MSQWQTFLRVLLTRWRRKPAGIDMNRNYVTVVLCCFKKSGSACGRLRTRRGDRACVSLKLWTFSDHISSVGGSDGRVPITNGIKIAIWTLFEMSIWTKKIRFKRSRFDLKILRFDFLKIFKSRQISCLLTDAKWNAWIIETLLFQCYLTPTLHRTNWLIDIVVGPIVAI